jgi:Thioredoxin
MIVQLLVALLLAVAAVAVAAVLRRRRGSTGPTQGPSWAAPSQLDRADFDGATAPWLVVVFSSATCTSCAAMVDKARVLASDDVAVSEVEAGARPDLHRRYGIEAVPITVVADNAGVVRASFIGPATATDLWAAVAQARS